MGKVRSIFHLPLARVQTGLPPSHAGMMRGSTIAPAWEPRVGGQATSSVCCVRDGRDVSLRSAQSWWLKGLRAAKTEMHFRGRVHTMHARIVRPPLSPHGQHNQRHPRPLSAVAASRSVEVEVALHREAELGAALAPRALGMQGGRQQPSDLATWSNTAARGSVRATNQTPA
jgi:hypothetical protein